VVLRTLHSAWVAQVDGWRMKGESCYTYIHTHEHKHKHKRRGGLSEECPPHRTQAAAAAIRRLSHGANQHLCFTQLDLPHTSRNFIGNNHTLKTTRGIIISSGISGELQVFTHKQGHDLESCGGAFCSGK
jgi:hypothetical protein